MEFEDRPPVLSSPIVGRDFRWWFSISFVEVIRWWFLISYVTVRMRISRLSFAMAIPSWITDFRGWSRILVSSRISFGVQIWALFHNSPTIIVKKKVEKLFPHHYYRTFRVWFSPQSLTFGWTCWLVCIQKANNWWGNCGKESLDSFPWFPHQEEGCNQW